MLQASIKTYQSALLGMVLARFTSKARDVVLSVPVEAFFDEYRAVRVAIEYLVQHETPVTVETVCAYLDDMGQPTLKDFVLTEIALQDDDGNLEAFAAKLADYHECNRSVSALKEVIANLRTASDASEALSRLEKVAKTVGRKARGRSAPQRLGTVINKLVDDAQRRGETGTVEGYLTGSAGIDKAFGRLKPGDLVVVAARPGMGKTELMLKLNKLVVQQVGCASLIMSFEMQNEQVGERYLSDSTQLPVDVFDDPNLLALDNIIDRLRDSAAEYEDLPIYLQEVSAATHHDVVDAAVQFAEEVPNLGLLTIDHLGLHKTTGNNRTEAIGDITRSYKNLALRLQIPVILLAQLNRNLEMREDKRPTNADLRESGAIEQDADKIVFIYRDSYYDINSPWGSVAELINGKRRRGEAGNSFMDFCGGHFQEVPRDFTPPIVEEAAKSPIKSMKIWKGIKTHDY